MAVIWQKTVDGKCYEVRSAGETRRLYTDGVFHSQYNPNRMLTGNVWDLLSLPSFFLPPEQLRHALVLGVGGGAVIRQLRQWYPEIRITGIELNPMHLYIARRFFDLEDPAVKLIEADAIKWMENYTGAPFDLIVDDLFFEEEGEPCRAIAADKSWISTLLSALTPHGMLVINFICSRDLRNSAVFHHKSLQARFKSAYRFMTPLYENNIGAFLRQPETLNQLRRRVQQTEQLQGEYNENQSKYQIRKINY